MEFSEFSVPSGITLEKPQKSVLILEKRCAVIPRELALQVGEEIFRPMTIF